MLEISNKSIIITNKNITKDYLHDSCLVNIILLTGKHHLWMAMIA